ncbi:5'-3' exoribonuclease [Gracilaria domingensis]|nr:5'-3' exoribonuclease [Gracilaria domingensis]
MAIDGVAPRAKMNQQRSRRFRSAKERADEHERLMAEDPLYAAADLDPFDSNCITPGTHFMQQLTLALKYFVANKITTDAVWANIQVVLSGAEAPGEGEHKIMQYIRAMREADQLPPNTRHCVYGLDADLIMLALVTHEPHFFILREKVDYTFWRKKRGPRQATTLDMTVFGEFELLSIGVLREYLVEDLGSDNNSKLPFFDIERLTDDFVFILMLIGNDFLPNLPTLDIADGTLDVLLHLYKRMLPIFGGYLTHQGTIIPYRLEFFLAKLGLLEQDVLKAKKELEDKSLDSRSRRAAMRGKTFANVDLDILFGFHLMDPGLLQEPFTRSMIRAESEALRERLKSSRLPQMKEAYYASKFGQPMSPDGLDSLSRRYVEGISWTLKYYTEGCRMWRWFYPYHYAPLASDVTNIAAVLNAFDNSITRQNPFRPLEQLMSVLPPKSAWCLPKPYRQLMTNAASPIRDFYPESFETDMNGKRNDWEAVVLLPFVDEERLLAAIRSIPLSEINEEERKRNELGPSLVYSRSKSSVEDVPSPFGSRLPSFTSMAVNARLELPSLPDGCPFSARLLPGTKQPSSNKHLVDLPSLRRVEFGSRLESISVNVFGMPSKSDSIVLVMGVEMNDEDELEDAMRRRTSLSSVQESDIAPGCPVWFGYPWRTPGYVETIANMDTTRKVVSQPKGYHKHTSTAHIEAYPTNKGKFTTDINMVVSELFQKKAIMITQPKEIIGVKRVKPESHVHYDGGDKVMLYHDRFVQRRTSPLSHERRQHQTKRIAENQMALYIGHGPYFGCMCTVLRSTGSGTVTTKFARSEASAKEAAFGYRIVAMADRSLRWLTTSRLAVAAGMKPAVVDAVLGSLRVSLSSSKEEIDLGLGIKYIARGLVVPGYARKDEKGIFVFSDLCINVLNNYRTAFPQLFRAIEEKRSEEASSGNGRGKGSVIYVAKEIFKGSPNPDGIVRAAATWISVQDVAQQPLVSASSNVLSEPVVKDLERHCCIVLALQDEYEGSIHGKEVKHFKDVPRSTLITGLEDPSDMSVFEAHRGSSHFTPVPVDGTGLRLGDRVVIRTRKVSVPFGLRGTVVGIHLKDETAERNVSASAHDETSSVSSLVEVVFDEGFISGGSLSGRCSDGRGKVVPAHHLLIIRPDRENEYYSLHYARMAAKMGQLKQEEEEKNESVLRRKAIAAAAAGFQEEGSMKKNEGHHHRSLAEIQDSPFRASSTGSSSATIPQKVTTESYVGLPKRTPIASSGSSKFSTPLEASPIREDQLPLPKFLRRKKGGNESEKKQETSRSPERVREERKLPNGGPKPLPSAGDVSTAQDIQEHVLKALLRSENEQATRRRGAHKESSGRKRTQRTRRALDSTRACEGDEDEFALRWNAIQEEERAKNRR